MDNIKQLNNLLDQSPEERTVELSDKQKKDVLEFWEKNKNPECAPDLKSLVAVAWGDKEDTRSWKGRLVREYLVSKQIKPRLTQEYVPKKKEELKPEEKEFVANNYHRMGALELARTLFNNETLSPLHKETKLVIDYLSELNPKVGEQIEEDTGLARDNYNPPKSLPQVLGRVNKNVYNGIDEKKITIKQKKQLWTLVGYLHTMRFNSQINTFKKIEERLLFESEFIRCTYDKDDLSEEEVDQYIVYATEVLISQSILNRIETLEINQDEQMEERRGQINIGLVDAVKSLRDEYNKCIKRQNDLLEDLKGKRKERINTKLKETASVLNLVQLWKEEETRKQLIDLANKEQADLKEEIERLSSLDEVKARIMGITEDEILFG